MRNANNTHSTKNEIIEKAFTLFKEKGYMNVTVDHICDECGITRGAFYYYYKTKDEILDDIFIDSNLITTKDISNLLLSDNYIEQFYNIHSNYLKRVLDVGPDVMGQVLKFRLGAMVSKDISAYEIYTALIQKAQDSKQIACTASASILADAAFYISNSLCATWICQKGNYDYEKEFKRLMDAIFMIT